MSSNSRSGKSPKGVIFGPVSSRRLGLSLGIDLLPAKVCSHDCVYCEVGRTTLHTCERREYIPTSRIVGELENFLTAPFCAPDCFTITASGEPTLHSGFGRIIRLLKEKAGRPVVVLTNATTITDAEIRRSLCLADIVVPSLDAASETAWRRVNRPARGCPAPAEVIDGLARFRQEYGGEIWLEILLVKGLNDSEAELAALARAASTIRPDLVQLNTVVRPPALDTAFPLSADDLNRAGRHFPGRVEVIAAPRIKGRGGGEADIERRITGMVSRRPCPAEEIAQALGLALPRVEPMLAALVGEGRIREKKHQGRRFFVNV